MQIPAFMHHIHESGICYQEDGLLATNLQNLVVLSCYLYAIVYPFNYSGCFDIFFNIAQMLLRLLYIREISLLGNIVIKIVVCPFVVFVLTIVLSVLLRYTDYDYPFGIFKLFLLRTYPSFVPYDQCRNIFSQYGCK